MQYRQFFLVLYAMTNSQSQNLILYHIFFLTVIYKTETTLFAYYGMSSYQSSATTPGHMLIVL